MTNKIKKRNKKVILGIDPGSTTIGYGILKCNGNINQPEVINYGYIDLKGHLQQEIKLLHLYLDLQEIYNIYKPDTIAIENIYFFKNVKTANSVIQSKGVILFSAAKAKIKIFEYTPLQVKQTISGYGKATKKFVEQAVKFSLKINKDIKPDDASDALAIALCHYRHLTNI
ncbi:MAG: crossover junction endodeoxyribonuclease RuvC [Candidatus Melainabacteria bacterium]|nr:crossover junction endodeoxyribonuclease RuvC [Candidatus Melainabacteria bacterium]MBI3309321.1 crossover junction endodeoxyribonuclease RuvC [Candidatus Melainabacteria bacterium]